MADIKITNAQGEQTLVDAKTSRLRALNRQRVKRWRERRRQKRGIEIDLEKELENDLTGSLHNTIMLHTILKCPRCGGEMHIVMKDDPQP